MNIKSQAEKVMVKLNKANEPVYALFITTGKNGFDLLLSGMGTMRVKQTLTADNKRFIGVYNMGISLNALIGDITYVYDNLIAHIKRNPKLAAYNFVTKAGDDI